MVNIRHSAHVKVRGYPAGVASLLPPCGFWGTGLRLSAASSFTHFCPKGGLSSDFFILTLRTETELNDSVLYFCLLASHDQIHMEHYGAYLI